jgi:hypothetical protein
MKINMLSIYFFKGIFFFESSPNNFQNIFLNVDPMKTLLNKHSQSKTQINVFQNYKQTFSLFLLFPCVSYTA